MAGRPEVAQRARAPVVVCVIEAGQPDSAVLHVHHRGFVEDAVPGGRAEQEDGGYPVVPGRLDRLCAKPSSDRAILSPMTAVGMLVLPEVTAGMSDASATYRPSTPCTRPSGSTTESG